MHVGLQVLESDVEHFYKQVLGGTIEGSFLLSQEDAHLIFGLDTQMQAYWLNCSGFTMELFVNEEALKNTCQHICFSAENAEAIYLKAKKQGYSFYIRKKYEKDTFFIKDSHGNLDYLIIDTPPGTGDIHITLLQNFETSGVIIVTTPQLMSLADVRKSIDLYQNNKLSTPILGIVENMSWFTPTKHPDEKYFLFGKGGGDELVKQFNIPLLAQIPFNEFICQTCDKGNLEKMLLDENVKTAFLSLAENLFSKIRIYQ